MEVLGDGEVMEQYGWIGKVERELVMTQGQRNRTEKECMKWLVDRRMGSTKGQKDEATWAIEELEGERAEQRSSRWLEERLRRRRRRK